MDNDDEDATMAAYNARYNADWAGLRAATRGRDVIEAEGLIRDWAGVHASFLMDVDVALMARVMSDAHWSRKHPLSAIALAWTHRRSRPPHQSLLWL